MSTSETKVGALTLGGAVILAAMISFLGAFKLNSRSKFHWQSVPGDTSASICCLSALGATYTDANPILSRS